MDGDIDYSQYTLRELEEALMGIRRERYPKNFANLVAAHSRLAAAQAAAGEPVRDAADLIEPDEPQPRYDAQGRYIPNEIDGGERSANLWLSLLLLAYGGYGVWQNDLWLPGKRGGLHLYDEPAWVMYAAMLCGCLVMVSVVVDHYDRRNNEKSYRLFAESTKAIGWILFALAVVFAIFRH